VPAVVVEPNDTAALALLQARGPTAVATVPRTTQDTLPAGAAYRTAQVIHWTPNRIEVQANGPGWLMVSQVWAPGWRAYVDSVQAEVYRTDVAFCGLPLPNGSHTVTLTYTPTGWVRGRWIGLGVVTATVVATVAVLWNQRRGASYGRRSKTSIPSDP
jgi:hypothetical protein